MNVIFKFSTIANYFLLSIYRRCEYAHTYTKMVAYTVNNSKSTRFSSYWTTSVVLKLRSMQSWNLRKSYQWDQVTCVISVSSLVVSLTVLKALSSPNTRSNKGSQRILIEQNNITLCLLTGHRNIPGIEEADKLAKYWAFVLQLKLPRTRTVIMTLHLNCKCIKKRRVTQSMEVFTRMQCNDPDYSEDCYHLLCDSDALSLKINHILGSFFV